MLQGITDASLQGRQLHHSDQINNVTTQYNDPEIIPLHTKINTVTNSANKSIDNAVFFSPDKNEDISAKSGLLKKLLVGASILTGMGLLAAGSFGCYIAVRKGNASPADKSLLSHVIKTPVTEQGIPSGINTLHDYSSEVVTKAEASLSPYSYYEGIYANKLRDKVPATATTKPAPVVTENARLNQLEQPIMSANTSTSEKTEASYRHENMRNIYYDTLPVDMYRPLGRGLYNELAKYCNSKIHTLVYHASLASPEKRCEILGEVVDEIDYYKNMDSLLRKANAHKDILSASEHADEIITRRKLTTAYLAGEYIIAGKNISAFYVDALADNKVYSAEELVKREEKIMNYFPTHHNDC